jgi:hypothetical protein
MFSTCKNFIKINEDLFLIKRVFKEESIKNVDLAKELLYSDHVFKRENLMYFCEKIHELEAEFLPQLQKTQDQII